MIFKKTILFIVSVFLVQILAAQVSASIKASVDKNKILLGEPLVLTIESYLSADFAINFVEIDSIPHFEFLGKPKLDSNVRDGVLMIKGVYTITSFDSGHWVIPSFSLAKGVKSDTIPIDVIFSEFDPKQDYHDIKDVIEVKVSKKKITWWIYAAGLLVLILVIALLTRRKKKPELITVPKLTISPYEEAMKELDRLKNEKLTGKEYYSKLVNVLRLYIFRKKGILSLQKTTDDFVVQLKSLQLDNEQFHKLSQSLRLSDFVKFAKYQSTDDEDNTSFETIKNTIKILEQSE